jgi:hypothetical protein
VDIPEARAFVQRLPAQGPAIRLASTTLTADLDGTDTTSRQAFRSGTLP